MPALIPGYMVTAVLIIVLVVLAIGTVYILVSRTLKDLHVVAEVLRGANERLTLVGVKANGVLYYAVRNTGAKTVSVTLYGYSGGGLFGLASTELSPGEVYYGYTYSTVDTIVAVTSDGVITGAPVINLDSMTDSVGFTVYTLPFAILSTESPFRYPDDSYSYYVSTALYGYVYGFVVADRVHGNESVIAVFGPYRVASFYENHEASFSAEDEETSGDMSLGARFNYTMYYTTDSPVRKAYYIGLSFTLDAPDTDTNKGVRLLACIGFYWRTMSNGLYGIGVSGFGAYTDLERGQSSWIGAAFFPYAVKGEGDIYSLIAEFKDMFDPEDETVTVPPHAVLPPGGGTVSLGLAYCVRLEDEHGGTITVPENSATTITLSDTSMRIGLYIKYPDKGNVFGDNSDIDTSGTGVYLFIDPAFLVVSILKTA